MSKRITDLRTTTKTETTSRQYLLISDLTSRESTKIALHDVFPALQSGKETGTVSAGTAGSIQDLFVGGGVGSVATNTNKSTLIFKGLKSEVNTSGSQSAALELRTDKSTADPNKQNLVMALNINKLTLNNADNTTSKFLSEVGGSNALSLAQPGVHFTGTLGVANGGTGLTSGTTGGLLTWTGSTTLGTITFRNKGSLLVGQQNAAPVELTVGSNGKFLKADSSDSKGVVWADATFVGGTLTSDLTMSSADIILGTNYLSGSGTASRGLRFNSSNDNVYIGTGTFYSTAKLNVDGSIHLGNTTGTSAVEIKAKSTTSGAATAMTIQGAGASGTGLTGGNLNIVAGAGEDTNSDGGALYLKGGAKDGSGTAGKVYIQTDGGTAVTVDENKDVNIKAGSLVIDTATEGIVHKGSATVTQSTDHTTGVTINATSGVITLAAVALAAANNAEFTVTNSTVQTDSVIILTVQDENTTNNAQLTACTHTIANGSFKISVFNPAATGSTSATASKIHFLIINNSV